MENNGWGDYNNDNNDRRRSRSRSPPRRSRERSRSRSPPRGRRMGNDRPDNPEPCTCIGVFGLSLRTNEADLQRVFEKFGEIEKHNQSRGFGFVYFKEISAAEEARNATNGMELDGRSIRVDFSVTRKPHEPTPGYYAGRPTRRSRSPPRRRHYRSRSPGYGRRRSRSRTPPYYRRRSRSRSPYGRR